MLRVDMLILKTCMIPGFFKPFPVFPLPFVFKFGGIFRLVISGIDVMGLVARQASIMVRSLIK